MAGVHIGSGSLVLQMDAPVTVEIGPCLARFSQGDEVAKSGIDFTVQVPFGVGVGKISHSNLSIDGEQGNFRLLIAFTSTGANGEFQAATYSLYQE